MADAGKLSDADFIDAYLSDYINDELSGDVAKRYEDLIAKDEFKAHVEEIRDSLGQFQLSLNAHFLSQEQRVALNDLVGDQDIRLTREAERIEKVSRWEALSDFRRRIALILGVVGIIFWMFYYFTPESRPSFNPLEVIDAEAMYMFEAALAAPPGRVSKRLDLPTDDQDEISAFVDAHKGFDYRPVLLERLPKRWEPEGVSIIDYDSAKVIAVQYRDIRSREGAERLLYFNLKGNISDFPPADPGKLGAEFTYFTFGTDFLNIIVWQPIPNVVSMLVSNRLTAPELAAVAHADST